MGIVHRRLDLVQVKGKTQPTDIYEIIGCDLSSSCSEDFMGQTQCRQAELLPIVDVVTRAIGKLNGGMVATKSMEMAMQCGIGIETEDLSDIHWEDDMPDFESAVTPEVDPQRREQAAKYEHALTAYQEARFDVAHAITTELLLEAPQDMATERLHERS